MATKKRRDQLGTLVADVEALAKRLRTGIRTQAAALPKDLKTLAARLRKQAIHAAAQVEKYAHEIRMELEGMARKAMPAKAKAKPRKKVGARAVARKRRAA